MQKFGDDQNQFKRDYARMINADEYVLRHLAGHLYKAGQFDRLYKLLLGNKAWMEAKFIRLGEDAEYLADLDLATSNFADPLTQSELLVLIQIRMARSVVNVRTNARTNNDLQTLVYLGRELEALSSARLRAKASEKFDGLQCIWATMFEIGVNDQALLEEILATAEDIDDPEKHASALAEVVEAFSLAGNQEKALETLMHIDNIGAFLDAQIGVVRALTQVGQIEAAFESVNKISHKKTKARAMAILSISLFQNNDGRASLVLKSAMEIVRKLNRADREVELLVLVNILARNGRLAEVRSILRGMSKKQSLWFHDAVIYKLASLLARNQQFDEMESILDNINDNKSFLDKPDLAAAITAGGNLDRALSMARSLDEPYKSMALRRVVETLAETRQYETLMAIVPDIIKKSQLWSDIAVKLAAAGDIHHAEIALRNAMADNEVDYLIYSAKLMRGDLASALAVAGYFDIGIALATSVKSRVGHSRMTKAGLENVGDSWSSKSEERTVSLFTIATALTWSGQVDIALKVVKQIYGKYDRAEAHLQICEALALCGNLDQAISLAERITYIDVRARALGKLGNALALAGDDRAIRVFSHALKLALRCVRHHETTLLAVASAFPPPSNPWLQRVFEDTIKEVCSANSVQKRITVLWDISAALALAGDQRAVAVFDDMLFSVDRIRARVRRSDKLQSIVQVLAAAGNCRARELLLEAYQLEYNTDTSWLSSFLESFTFYLIDEKETIDNLMVNFADGANDHTNRFLEAKFDEIGTTEDIYFKMGLLNDIMIFAALMGDNRATKALESLMDLVIRDTDLEDLEVGNLRKRLADAGDIRASILSEKLSKLRYSYDNQIQWYSRLQSYQILGSIAANKRWVETLKFLDVRNHPYELLGIFASWTTVFEKAEKGCSVILLREALHIAGWLGQDPYYIASLFVYGDQDK